MLNSEAMERRRGERAWRGVEGGMALSEWRKTGYYEKREREVSEREKEAHASLNVMP